MTFYTEADLTRGLTASASTPYGARDMLRKQALRNGPFDIFLSHAKLDEVVVWGVKEELEKSGVSVYVDWIDDPQLDRSRVTSATADMIRRRMRDCRAMVYATSPAAAESRWMPWELGFFDGHRGSAHISVMPILKTSRDHFAGLEFLGLYDLVHRFQNGLGDLRAYSTRLGGLEAKTMEKLVDGSSSYQRVTQR